MEKPSNQRQQKDVSPKITSTKTTICKSSPFLIRKHHLDDSEMRKVMRCDDQTVKRNLPRTYSYKAEVVTCLNSKLQPSFSTFQKTKPDKTDREAEYYDESQVKRRRENNSNYEKLNNNTNEAIESIHRHAQHQMANMNDYGLKQMTEARKKIQEEAEKLRKIYKKKVEDSIKNQQASRRTVQLEEEIKQLKIKNLQLQKRKWLDQLHIKTKITQSEELPQIRLQKTIKVNSQRGYLIINKPRFHIKHRENDDTDSSFSSFQFQ